jgi:hypothetical protein
MLITRCTIATALLLGVSLAGLGTTLLAHRAWAARPAPEQPLAKEAAFQKDKKEVGPTIQATVKAVDGTKNTVTVNVMTDPAKKRIEEKTFELAKDAKVLLEHGLRKEVKEGKLADLTKGTPVSLQLTPDKKGVQTVHVRGRGVHGGVKSVDAVKNTITVTVKEDGKVVDKTFALMKEAKVILDDGLLTKKDTPKEGKLGDLTEGLPVWVQLSGYDQKTAVGVRASGPSLQGTVKGVDVGNNTITVTVKENGAVVDKTLNLAKNAKIVLENGKSDGKLVEVTEGATVSVQLSVFDSNAAAWVRMLKKE